MDSIIRAFEMPVQVVEPSVAWETIRQCWHEATCLANWCVVQLVRHDVVRLPGMAKLPPMPKINGKRLKGLYGLASETFGFTRPGSWWAGACISASTICRDVETKYRNERLNVVWHRKQAPCTYRYPYPWPVHAQAWRAARLDRNDRPCVEIVLPSQEFALPDGGVGLRLRGGAEFGRQMALFRQVAEGRLPRLQLVIREQRCSSSCHRPRLMGREDSRVMVKMVAHVSARKRPGTRPLVLLTDPHAFWVAELDDKRAWVLNNDHFRRGLARHSRYLRRLDRIAQDGKAERRIQNQRFDAAQQRIEDMARKDRRRLDSWTHESAAHLVGYAQRQRVGEVLYLDGDRGFLPDWPWHVLHQKLADKCAAAGIDFYSETQLRLSGGVSIDTDSQDIRPAEDDDKWQRIARLREMATRRLVAARKRTTSHPDVCAP